MFAGVDKGGTREGGDGFCETVQTVIHQLQFQEDDGRSDGEGGGRRERGHGGKIGPLLLQVRDGPSKSLSAFKEEV